MESLLLLLPILLVSSMIIPFGCFASFQDIPDNFVISTDPYLIQRTLTVYDTVECKIIARVERRLSSFNQDVDVYQNEKVISSTNYHSRFNSWMDVFKGSNQVEGTHIFRVTTKFGDDFSTSLLRTSYMEIFATNNTKHSKGESSTLVAYIKGSEIFENKFDIFSASNHHLLYSVRTNAWNFKTNKCRSKNLFAESFYTVESNSLGASVIRRDLFLGKKKFHTFELNLNCFYKE